MEWAVWHGVRHGITGARGERKIRWKELKRSVAQPSDASASASARSLSASSSSSSSYASAPQNHDAEARTAAGALGAVPQLA